MPVIYEGEPSSLLLPSASDSGFHPLALHSPCRFRTSSLLPSLSLAGLCGCIALLALLGTYLRRRRQRHTRAVPVTTLPLPLHIRAFVLEQEHLKLDCHAHRYIPEKRTSVASLAASYYDTEDDLGMEKSPTDSPNSTNNNNNNTNNANVSPNSSFTGSSPVIFEEPATMQAQNEQEEWASTPQWQDSATAMTSANSASQISAMDGPPRRRSYQKMKSQSQSSTNGNGSANANGQNGQSGDDMQVEVQVQEEIVVAEGWRRHTRVYGGGVCLACAESERRNMGGGVFKGVERGGGA